MGSKAFHMYIDIMRIISWELYDVFGYYRKTQHINGICTFDIWNLQNMWNPSKKTTVTNRTVINLANVDDANDYAFPFPFLDQSTKKAQLIVSNIWHGKPD